MNESGGDKEEKSFPFPNSRYPNRSAKTKLFGLIAVMAASYA